MNFLNHLVVLSLLFYFFNGQHCLYLLRSHLNCLNHYHREMLYHQEANLNLNSEWVLYALMEVFNHTTFEIQMKYCFFDWRNQSLVSLLLDSFRLELMAHNSQHHLNAMLDLALFNDLEVFTIIRTMQTLQESLLN